MEISIRIHGEWSAMTLHDPNEKELQYANLKIQRRRVKMQHQAKGNSKEYFGSLKRATTQANFQYVLYV